MFRSFDSGGAVEGADPEVEARVEVRHHLGRARTHCGSNGKSPGVRGKHDTRPVLIPTVGHPQPATDTGGVPAQHAVWTTG